MSSSLEIAAPDQLRTPNGTGPTRVRMEAGRYGGCDESQDIALKSHCQKNLLYEEVGRKVLCASRCSATTSGGMHRTKNQGVRIDTTRPSHGSRPSHTLKLPERRGAGKGAPGSGAAKRTLAGEHRSGIAANLDGRIRRVMRPSWILLVSSERVLAGIAHRRTNAVSPAHFELIQRTLPMLHDLPFRAGVAQGQVQQLQRRLFVRERTAILNDFP
jgi:hypothetical protein